MRKISRFCLSILMPIACVFSVGFLSLKNVEIADSAGLKKGGGLVVQNGSTFTLEGNKSVSGFSADYGGGIYVYSGGTLNINGGDIFSNSATTNGGGVFVEYGATLNMTDGTVSRNQTNGGGAGVFSYGSFTLSGGTISSNIGNEKSSAVYSSGGFTMTGGNVIGNVQTGYSDRLVGGTIVGNVYVSGSTTIGNLMNIAGNIFHSGNVIFLCENGDPLKVHGEIKGTGTIMVQGYQGNDFTGMKIDISDNVESFADKTLSILTFSGGIQNLDLKKFNISGFDKSLYSLKVVHEDGSTKVRLVSNDGKFDDDDAMVFTSDWKTEIVSPEFMVNPFGKVTDPYDQNSTIPNVKGISFSKTPKDGYEYAGTLSSGIKVYRKWGIWANFVGDHIYAPKDCEGLFMKSDRLYSTGTGYTFDFIDMSGLDTSRVTSMRALFTNAKITYINMTGCDTSNVKDTSFMFYGTVITGGTLPDGTIKESTLNLLALNLEKVGKFETSVHKDDECQNEGTGSAFRMFKGCSVKNLYLPTSMTKLESSHMFFDAKIDRLYFSNIEYVSKFCFYYAQIGELNGTLGNSSGQLTLSYYSFAYLKKLESIVFPAYMTYLNENGEKIGSADSIAYFLSSELKRVEFLGHSSTTDPDPNAQFVPNLMFNNSSSLDTVKLGEGITSVGGAFSGAHIKNLYVPSTLNSLSSVGGCGQNTNVYITDAKKWGEMKVDFRARNIYLNGEPLKNLELSFDEGVHDFPKASTNFGGCETLQTITITGQVKIPDYAFSGCTSLRSVTFNSAVELKQRVFRSCTSLMNVTFNSTANIGDYAFQNCTSLTKFDFKDSLTLNGTNSCWIDGCSSLTEVNFLSENTITINSNAFSGCSSLMKVKFNSAVSVGFNAFSNCTSLMSLTFNSSATFGGGSFSGCTSLTKLKFPSSVDFGYSAFKDCTGLIQVECPTIKKIGNDTFYNCTSLQALNDGTISYSGTLGFSAFYNCKSLRELNNTEQSTGIGSFAFSGCTSLKKVSWKAVSGSVGSDAFKNCPSLETLNLNSENLTYDQLSGKTLTFSTALTGDTSLKELILPPTTTSTLASTYLFEQWTSSQFGQLHVEAPYLVMTNFKSVNSLKILYSGDSEFKLYSNSQGLSCKKVELVDGFTKIETSAFYYSSIEELILPSTVTGDLTRTCYYCNTLKRVDISKTQVTSLVGAFDNCTSLVEVEMPRTLVTIGEGAFAGCTSLNEIEIPALVTEIGYLAFYGSNKLETVNFYSISDLSTIGMNAFLDCSNLRDLNNIEFTKVTNIGEQAFGSCENLKNFAFPRGYCKIGRKAFYNCKLLRIYDFTLNSTAGQTYIGDQAFMNCYSLGLDENGNNVDSNGRATEKITIKNNYQPYTLSHSAYYYNYGIGSYAFQNCISIAELDVSAVSIGPGAFSYCTKLETLTIDVDSINTNGNFNLFTGGKEDSNSNDTPKDTFYGCANLKTTYYGGNWKEIPQSCFYGCVQMTQFRPASGATSAITTIGEKAFKYCLSFVTTIQNITDAQRGIYLKASTKYKCSLTTNFTTGSDGKVPSSSVSKLVDSNSDEDWTLGFASTSDSSSIITVPEQTTEITTQTLEREVNQQRILPENKKNFVEEDQDEGEEE